MRLFKNGNHGAPPPPEPAPPAPAPPAAGPAGPDAAEAVARYENALKDMSERLATLTSSLESNAGDRAVVQEKLGLMEDRMRKLAALTEMASARYNPFVGDEPGEATRFSGDDAQPATSAAAPAAFPPMPTAPFPDSSALPTAAALPSAMSPARDDPRYFAMEPDVRRAHLERVGHTLENARTLLSWAENLLGASGSREGLDDLLQYYETIGWISADVRAELLAYAAGLPGAAWESERPPTDWRGGLDVHERTLLYIEKLRTHGP